MTTFCPQDLTDSIMQLNAQRNTTNADIIQHFHSGGALTAETAVLYAAVRDIVISGKKATGKAIILYLIAGLERSSDVVGLDAQRPENRREQND